MWGLRRICFTNPTQTRGTSNMKALNLQLKSMGNIQKIVQTMKVVSTAKYAKAKKDLTIARPYGQGTNYFYTKIDVPETDQKAKTVLIGITSDRGLCGALHKNVASKMKEEFEKKPHNTSILSVGEKTRALLASKYGDKFMGVVSRVGRRPHTFLDASMIANAVMKSEHRFTSGKVIYNESKSAVTYKTVELPIFSPEAVSSAPSVRKYEMSQEKLDSFIEFSIASIIFFALKEARASEQSSRVAAMDQATKTAKEMREKLTTQLNKYRQGAITTSLNEIISGAMAVEDSK